MRRGSEDKTFPIEALEFARHFAMKVTNNGVEPLTPASEVVFIAGGSGVHDKSVVCVSRWKDNERAQSFSAGVLSVKNLHLPWRERLIQLESLDRFAAPLILNDSAYQYRIVAERVCTTTSMDMYLQSQSSKRQQARVIVPEFEEWFKMSRKEIEYFSSVVAAPPEVFSKYSMLPLEQPFLAQIAMTNYASFRRWVVSQRQDSFAVSSEFDRERLLVADWIAKGRTFEDWYTSVVQPLIKCR